EAEAIRDSLLAVSGALDRRMGGEHPFPPMKSWEFTQHRPFIAVYDHSQRSVYLMSQRIPRHPYFGTFDAAEPNLSTPRRITSRTALQALWMLNAPFVHEQGRVFASRLLKERPDDAARIERGFALALGRTPSSEEREACLDYVRRSAAELDEKQAWESF